jgi:hypothetical protein
VFPVGYEIDLLILFVVRQSPGCATIEGLVERPSKWRPALDLGPVHVGFVVNSVTLREVSLPFSLSVSFLQCFIRFFFFF